MKTQDEDGPCCQNRRFYGRRLDALILHLALGNLQHSPSDTRRFWIALAFSVNIRPSDCSIFNSSWRLDFASPAELVDQQNGSWIARCESLHWPKERPSNGRSLLPARRVSVVFHCGMYRAGQSRCVTPRYMMSVCLPRCVKFIGTVLQWQKHRRLFYWCTFLSSLVSVSFVFSFVPLTDQEMLTKIVKYVHVCVAR